MHEQENENTIAHEELPEGHSDPLISFLHRIIRMAVRVLAILMVFIIIFSIADVMYVFYQRLAAPPHFLLEVNDIFQIFGTVMVVLIAVEIFINVRLYLGTDVLPLRLVIATALMAISRKVIILDLDAITADYILGIAAVTISLGITYWLISKKT
jgi:uncharacterized membrane protein (DUF373 family)